MGGLYIEMSLGYLRLERVLYTIYLIILLCLE